MSTVLQSDLFGQMPSGLREPLLEEYRKIARNYAEARWEPAELNGGKLCEVVYSIIKGHVDGKFPAKPAKPKNMVEACRALENCNGFSRSVRLQIPRLVMALYEIRNGRSVGHVGGDVDPNRMDASLVMSTAQWLIAELVRIFHKVSTEEATMVVTSLTERRIPLLWHVGGKVRVLRNTMSFKDKAFAVMYGTTGQITSRFVIESIEYSNPSVFRKTILIPAHKAALLDYSKKTDEIVLSPLGIRYVEENIDLQL